MKDKLVSALEDAIKFAKEELDAIGPCDHSVNICVCGIISMIETWEKLVRDSKRGVK